jgi:hypothetical protein
MNLLPEGKNIDEKSRLYAGISIYIESAFFSGKQRKPKMSGTSYQRKAPFPEGAFRSLNDQLSPF